MDTETLVNIALVLVFVLIGGVFAGTELAMVSLRESQIKQFEGEGSRGEKLAALARNPNRFLSAVQIGVTLAGFFSAAYGASTIAPDLAPILSGWGLSESAADTVAFLVLTLIIAYLSLVLGELVPKRLAMQRAVGFARLLGPPLGAFANLMRPVIWFLSVSTNAVVRLLGGDPEAKTEEMSADELAYAVGDTQGLAYGSRAILTDVLGAGDRSLREVMRPRTEVFFLDADATLDDARETVHDLAYSRYPVIGESVDDVVGFVHIRDLLDSPTSGAVREVVRPILALPLTNRVLETLSMMRRGNHHITLVLDEYGGTAGIVTLEDIVEEVVGEIYDEYDSRIEPEDAVVRSGDTIRVDGGLILQEFARVTGIELPEGDYETVAGFVLDRLGRIPDAGDVVDIRGYRLEVLDVTRRRVGHILLRPRPEEQ
ncbi:hemolysin family protein [Rhodococcus sp. HNM0569]|uniref:hemolysin family protein n=1 Tax=Rhodococcus sp. HNM0569 TaxID=2716340 RepID=UPI00146A591C|nr:hemolysin family protein [Rhodococcus sp. HNM0569]NLU83504.1 HlyC/CorC family transporter [Rhodococcus sp. HNM0569]